MDIYGSPTKDWQARLAEVGTEVRDAIVRAWPRCAKDIGAGQLGHEDHITERLVLEMRRDPKIRDAAFILQYQHTLLEWGPDNKPKVTGIVDIAALYDSSHVVYYACEAKRLHVPTVTGRRSGAAAYVRDGVTRYSQGQYSSGAHLAAMLGYVLDADVTGAEKSISKAVRRRAVQIGCTSNPPLTFSNGQGVSLHSRGTGSQIQVNHVLLSL